MKCTNKKCKSTEFIIVESIIWNAFWDKEDNVLHAKNTGNEIESITCKKCGNEMTEQFKEKEINFQ